MAPYPNPSVKQDWLNRLLAWYVRGLIKRISILLLLSFAALSAEAAEKEIVCAKYRIEYGWSKSYKVEATIIKGTELNRATHSLDYNGLATYVAIFWDKDQVSIIEMSWPHLSAIGQEGEDQRGTKWEIAKTSICF